jgi:hypothetical protein
MHVLNYIYDAVEEHTADDPSDVSSVIVRYYSTAEECASATRHHG